MIPGQWWENKNGNSSLPQDESVKKYRMCLCSVLEVNSSLSKVANFPKKTIDISVPNPKLLLHVRVSAQIWADGYIKTEFSERILKYITREFRAQKKISNGSIPHHSVHMKHESTTTVMR